jgi:hypothetical protein
MTQVAANYCLKNRVATFGISHYYFSFFFLAEFQISKFCAMVGLISLSYAQSMLATHQKPILCVSVSK